ncbi:MAG: aminotransferase class I/II-fold pyridoxal phosphate-dependent enzyme [Defluviitaleaceae bacterium]|nr:aminotransferase class I/II-fold pyridoxal phosphate-dependent enzyme [Defluviitaleaceae bacterium]
MKFLSEKAKRLTPYTAGLQPREDGWIKLNTNENPYPPSPRVFEVLHNFDTSRLRLYPDMEATELKEAIVADENLDKETTIAHVKNWCKTAVAEGKLSEKVLMARVKELCGPLTDEDFLNVGNVFCANGNDEVLALAFAAFFSGKERVLSPDISYGFYPVWGEMFDVEMQFVSLGADFSINPLNYVGGNGVVIANPNAPTSLVLQLADIEKILKQNPDGVVLIDETYMAYARAQSAVALVGRYENLLVTRTFSKSRSLAGLRVGYAIGQPHLIDGLRRARDAFNSYPLDLVAQKCAAAAMSDREYFDETTAKVIATREKTIASLQEIGCNVLPSQANFIFMESSDAPGLYEFLCQNKILVRHWDNPRIKNFLRISIGTDEEMGTLCRVIKQFREESKCEK